MSASSLPYRQLRKYRPLTDTLGNLIRCVVLPGQRHDLQGVEQLLEGVNLQALLADKAFRRLVEAHAVRAQGCQVVIA
jgi:hypothetical protein